MPLAVSSGHSGLKLICGSGRPDEGASSVEGGKLKLIQENAAQDEREAQLSPSMVDAGRQGTKGGRSMMIQEGQTGAILSGAALTDKMNEQTADAGRSD